MEYEAPQVEDIAAYFEHLECEITELRASLSLITATLEKVYNVVKIIYWDNQRPATAARGRQTTRAVGKQPDLLRHVLTKSQARAGRHDGKADLITGSPPHGEARRRQTAPGVSYDLLDAASSCSPPAGQPSALATSDDAALEWVKILPRLLDLCSSRREDDGTDDHVPGDLEVRSGKVLKPPAENRENLVGDSDTESLTCDGEILASACDLEASSGNQVDSVSYDMAAENPEAYNVPVFPPSENGTSQNPMLLKKMVHFLSSAQLSPLDHPVKYSSDRDTANNPCPESTDATTQSSIARGQEPKTDGVIEPSPQDDRDYVLGNCQALLEQMVVIEPSPQDDRDYVLGNCQALLEQMVKKGFLRV